MGNWNPNSSSNLGYIPTGLYNAIAEIQREYSTPERPLGIKEIEITLLRAILSEKFGFKCEHDEERIKTNKDGKTYCSWCWSRFDILQKRELKKEGFKTVVTTGRYRRKKTFLEPKEITTDPRASLQPDHRGGE